MRLATALLAVSLVTAGARGQQPPVATLPGDEVVISATRSAQAAADAPTPVRTLQREDLARSPGKPIDEKLRVDPSFGLFRRSSSLVADPSSQGVNLRGIGPSGVPRALVLVDGVPAGDPFGGWVYWRAMPRLAIDRVEIAPGGASALFGSGALGGVVQMVSAPIEDAAEIELDAGLPATGSLSARAGLRRGAFAAELSGELLGTDGYFVVPGEQRGAIDRRASSRHANAGLRLEAVPRDGLAFFARGTFFTERQAGGTAFTRAEARRGEGMAGATLRGTSGTLDARAFFHAARFEQQRARIIPDATTRSSEALSALQGVPARDAGGSVVWTSPADWTALPGLGAHAVTAGVDVRRAQGTSAEDLFAAVVAPSTVTRREAGGDSLSGGLFVNDVFRPVPALHLSAGLRVDGWTAREGVRREDTSAGVKTVATFADRTAVELSPRFGAVVRPVAWLALRAAAYQAFRAPTLNELYRPFQVGQVRTEANEALQAEVLRGAEASAEVRIGEAAVTATAFGSDLLRPIANVTVGTNLQQRKNLGRARFRGVELSASSRVGPLRGSAAYTYVDPTVVQANEQPELVGKALAQDPRHRASVQLAWDQPRVLSATVQLRLAGRQFEDDRNTLELPSAATVDVWLGRRLARGVELFFAVENVFDRQVLVGRSGGVDTIGQPRFIHGGLWLALR